MSQRLNTLRKNVLDSAVRWSKQHEKTRQAERALVASVENLCAADPDIEGFDLAAALESAKKHEKRTRGRRN